MKKIFLAFMLLFSLAASAEIVGISGAGDMHFFYNTDEFTRQENIVAFWLVSPDQRLNFAKDEQFGSLGMHMVLDCKEHKYMMNNLTILDLQGEKLFSKQFKEEFIEALPNTLPDHLLTKICDVES